jgi:anti-sigma regulatory factor (Ser/Thr protein kinase)
MVGGDFYDVWPCPGGCAVLVGDVCGKGADAARMTALCRHAVRALMVSDPGAPPSRIVERLNATILDFSESRELCTLSLAHLELTDAGDIRATICGAGHPPALVTRSNGRVELVPPTGGLLGWTRDLAFTDAEVRLGPGDGLLLYTDGVIEARRGSVLFGEARLRRLLSRVARLEPRQLMHALEEELRSFHAGEVQRDDIAVIAVKPAGQTVETTAERGGGGGSAAGEDVSPWPPGATSGGDAPLAPRLVDLPRAVTFHREMAADARTLFDLRASLREWLRGVDADPRAVPDLLVAITEACANAIEHAGDPAERTILITGRRENGDVVLSVSDDGTWRVPAAPGDRGRGIPLIEAMVDRLVLSRGSRGTTLTMRRSVTSLGRSRSGAS